MNEPSQTKLFEMTRQVVEGLNAQNERLKQDLMARDGEIMLLKRRIAHFENVPVEMIW